MSAHKEEIARLRKMAHKGVKAIQAQFDIYEEIQCKLKIEDIQEYIEILRNVLVDIEDIAVMNGKYTIDKIIQYIDEGNDSLDIIEDCISSMDDKEAGVVYNSIIDFWDDQVDTAYGNIQHFVFMFNKLTKMQKDS